jgi:hypothetical protein
MCVGCASACRLASVSQLPSQCGAAVLVPLLSLLILIFDYFAIYCICVKEDYFFL